jgi:hypothetical protein
MASKMKIAEFVASTARYAKKAGLAADKNKDGKVSRTEAKSLPVDLRDDYARQAKLKSTITPGGFARDQAAYVAAASRRADKNKDGVLTKTEAKSLAAALKNNYENYAASLGSTPVTPTDGFVGKGKGKVETLGGKSFSNLPLSTGISQLVAKLATDADNPNAYAAAFKGKPSDVAAALANPQANKQFFNDLLFRATGTTFDKDYPDYYVPSELSINALTAAQALSGLIGEFSENGTPTSSEVPADAKALLDAMKEPGVKLFHLNWNNQDDASFDATIAMNPATGTIRVVGQFNEP